MLDKLASLLLASAPVLVPILGDIAALVWPRLHVKLSAWGLTSKRMAHLRDAYAFMAPRLIPGVVSLVKAAIGAKHPDVTRLVESAAQRAANLRAVK